MNPWLFEGLMFMIGFAVGYLVFYTNLNPKEGEEAKVEHIIGIYVKIFAVVVVIACVASAVIWSSAIAPVATLFTMVIGYFVGIIIYGMVNTHMTV